MEVVHGLIERTNLNRLHHLVTIINSLSVKCIKSSSIMPLDFNFNSVSFFATGSYWLHGEMSMTGSRLKNGHRKYLLPTLTDFQNWWEEDKVFQPLGLVRTLHLPGRRLMSMLLNYSTEEMYYLNLLVATKTKCNLLQSQIKNFWNQSKELSCSVTLILKDIYALCNHIGVLKTMICHTIFHPHSFLNQSYTLQNRARAVYGI